jgi:hypothetical protein
MKGVEEREQGSRFVSPLINEVLIGHARHCFIVEDLDIQASGEVKLG